MEFEELDRIAKSISEYDPVELNPRHKPTSPGGNTGGRSNPFGYSVSKDQKVAAIDYKQFAIEHGIKHSIDDIICPVCFDQEMVKIPFIYGKRIKNSRVEGGTSYFSHHQISGDYQENHAPESEWHVWAKNYIKDFILNSSGDLEILQSQTEVWNADARRRSDVKVEDSNGNMVAFEIQHSEQTADDYSIRHDAYAQNSIHDQWLYHSGCSSLHGSEDYKHALILDYNLDEGTGDVGILDIDSSVRIGVIVTKRNGAYYTFPEVGTPKEYYAIYTPISEWKYSPTGLAPVAGTSASRLLKLLAKMPDLLHQRDEEIRLNQERLAAEQKAKEEKKEAEKQAKLKADRAEQEAINTQRRERAIARYKDSEPEPTKLSAEELLKQTKEAKLEESISRKRKVSSQAPEEFRRSRIISGTRSGVYSQADALTIPRFCWFLDNHFHYDNDIQKSLSLLLATNFDFDSSCSIVLEDEVKTDAVSTFDLTEVASVLGNGVFWETLKNNGKADIRMSVDERWHEVALNYCRVASVEEDGTAFNHYATSNLQRFSLIADRSITIEEALTLSREAVYTANINKTYELPRFTGGWPGHEVWYESNRKG